MAYPPVIIVDEHDRETGLAMLAEVWERGLCHRVVRIMAEDGRGNVLLQKRSPEMILFPGRWDNSAAGHVDAGMTYDTAALQEVAEELGVVDAQLDRIGHFFSDDIYEGRQMRQFSMVYRLHLTGLPATRDRHEVAGFQWLPIAEAGRLAAAHPEAVTYGLAQVLARYYTKGADAQR